MRIDSLKVQNFRCFEQALFRFSPSFNILIGPNGGGKSSLLMAIVASLATPMNGLKKGVVWPHADERNVRVALTEVNGRVRFDQCYPVRLEVSGEIGGQDRSWWLALEGPGSDPKWEHTVFYALSELAGRAMKSEAGALPVVAIYLPERQWKLKGVAPDQAVRQRESRLDGYASWHDAAADLKGFEAWVVSKSLERLERLSYAEQGILSQEPDELDLVSRAVAEAFPGSIGVRFDIKYRRMVLDWKDGKPSTPFELLSDGQRGLTALIADIARRMCLLNPQLGNDVLAQTPGIVVIDELDIHLHPAWQRRIVPLLKRLFPKVQFFAATHSPQIIGELPAEEIILLQEGQAVGHPEYSLGLDSAEILEALMDSPARNAKVAEELHAIRRAIDNDDLESAQELLDALESEVGAIPEVLGNRSAINSLRLLEDDGQ